MMMIYIQYYYSWNDFTVTWMIPSITTHWIYKLVLPRTSWWMKLYHFFYVIDTFTFFSFLFLYWFCCGYFLFVDYPSEVPQNGLSYSNTTFKSTNKEDCNNRINPLPHSTSPPPPALYSSFLQPGSRKTLFALVVVLFLLFILLLPYHKLSCIVVLYCIVSYFVFYILLFLHLCVI